MRRPWTRLACGGVIALAFMGCERTLENVEVVYPAIAGSFELRWNLPAEGIARVQYRIDGQVVGASKTANDRFSATVDTRTLANGPHTLQALAENADGATLRAVSYTLLVRN